MHDSNFDNITSVDITQVIANDDIIPFRLVRQHLCQLEPKHFKAIMEKYSDKFINIADVATSWGDLSWKWDDGGRQRLCDGEGEPVGFYYTGTQMPHVTNYTDLGTLYTLHMANNAISDGSGNPPIPNITIRDAPYHIDRLLSEVRNSKVTASYANIKPGAALYIFGIKGLTPTAIANTSLSYAHACSLVDKDTFPAGTINPTQSPYHSVGKDSVYPTDAQTQLVRKIWAPEAVAIKCNDLEEDTGAPPCATSFCPPLTESSLITGDPDFTRAKMTRLDWPLTLGFCEEGNALVDTHSLNQADDKTVFTVFFHMELAQWKGKEGTNWRIDWVPFRFHIEGLLKNVPNTTSFYSDKVNASATPSPRKRKVSSFADAFSPRKLTGTANTNKIFPDDAKEHNVGGQGDSGPSDSGVQVPAQPEEENLGDDWEMEEEEGKKAKKPKKGGKGK